MLEAATLEALARLLTRRCPEALGIERAALLLWNRKLDSFEALTPGETHLAALRPDRPASPSPKPGFLLSEGTLLRTRGGRGEGVLVPLMARSGVVGMLVLDARAGRRKLPFRPTEVRLLSVLANRAALALENHLYQKELISSERMAALGAMAGMLAHDFRNPMTVVRGYAEMLLEDGVRPERCATQAALIVRMVDRLDRMTARDPGLRARGRAGGAPHASPCGRFLGRARRRDRAASCPACPSCATSAVPEEAAGALDEDKIRRAVGNLAANARDVMGGRGPRPPLRAPAPADGRRHAGAPAPRGRGRGAGGAAGDPRHALRALRDRAQEGRHRAGPGRGPPLRRGPRGTDRAGRREPAVGRAHGRAVPAGGPLAGRARPGGDAGAR